MTRACLYIITRSIKNAVVSKVRRLKEPKYAVALIVGLGYLGLVVGGWILRAASGKRPPPLPVGSADELFGWGAILLGLLYLVFIWIFKAAGPGLLFKPAEVHYLFTAPATRRQVIHYYLLRGQPQLLLTVALMALFGLIWFPGFHPLYSMVSIYIVFNVIFFHQTAASLVRASVFRHGMIGAKHNLVGLVILGVVMSWIGAQAVGFKFGKIMEPTVIEAFLRDGLDSPVAYFALYPLRAVGLLLASHDLGTFLFRLVPVAGLLVLHYIWVIRSDVAFEEASQERSRVVAERMERVRKGRSPFARTKGKATRQPFRLGPHGPALTAIFWKNMISTTRLPVAYIFAALIALGLAAWIGLGRTGEPKQSYVFASTFLVGLGAFLLFAGPQWVRRDLRQDLAFLDILKALPLSGAAVVIGEILTPLAILFCIELLLGAFAVLFGVSAGVISAGKALSVFLAVSIVYPCFAALWLLLDSTMLLHFSDWVPRPTPGRQGIEVMGAAIVYFLLMFLALGLLLAPAILVGVVGFLVGGFLLGFEVWPIALVVAVVPAAGVILAECAILLRFVARKYEAFDFSTEVTSLGGS